MVKKNFEFHGLIAQIYETAADPDKWPELLDALAESVDFDQKSSLPDTQPTNRQISDSHRIESITNSSLTQALSLIPAFNEKSESVENPNTETDIRQINSILLQHFKSALKVAQRLIDYEENKEVIVSVLDRLPVALIVVDSTGHIIECNPQARKIAELENGISMHEGYLSTAHQESRNKLKNAILTLSKKAPSANDNLALVLPLSEDKNSYIMAFLSPVKANRNSAGLSNVTIFLSWPKSQPFTVSTAIRQLYSLTATEEEIISLLVRGYCIKEIAQERDVSEHTIRSQVKSVLQKTKTTRQSDLIKLALTGPSSMFDEATKKYALSPHTSSKYETRIFELGDGRRMAYSEYGDPTGIPLFYFHSLLGSRLEFSNFGPNIADQNGFRVICPERPGYGLSDPMPDLTFQDWANDIEKLADHLELEQFSIAGYAMGPIFGCAVAFHLPERVKRLLIISSGVAAKTRQDFAQMNPLYRMSNKMARDFPQVFRIFTSLTRKSTLRNPERFFERLVAELPPHEASLINTQEFKQNIIEDLNQSWQQGSHQVSHEMELLMNPWDFRPEEIETPADIWHGTEDHHVSCIVGEKLANLMPNANFYAQPGHGHYMIYFKSSKIFSHFGTQLDTMS